ncbi:hypothetical protein T484DRAFT_1913121 [Baffinella frigidus]|nr:hypothetical protein T484DRAFT_1913121 [Cryptophyta sp. CCMP2293]
MSDASQAGEVFRGAPEHFKDWWNGFKAGLSEKNAHLLMFSHRVEADQPGVTPEEKDFGYGLAASAETIWLSKILSTTDYKSWTKGQEIEHELQQLELQASAVTSDDEEEAGARSEAGSITQVSAATAAAIARVNKAVISVQSIPSSRASALES